MSEVFKIQTAKTMQTILFILKFYTNTEINYHSSKLPHTFSMQLLKNCVFWFLTKSNHIKSNTFVTNTVLCNIMLNYIEMLKTYILWVIHD